MTLYLLIITLLLMPVPTFAEVELFALAGWPVYQRQTEVTSAGYAQLGTPRRSFTPQANPSYGGGLTWWGTPALGLRADFMILQPNVPPSAVFDMQKGWHQRIVVGTLSVMGRFRLTDRLRPYGGIGLAKTSAKQCDEIGCTPNTDGWGAVATLGLQYQVWKRVSVFTEIRHLATSFRYANEPQGAFASDVNITTAHIGLTWQVW